MYLLGTIIGFVSFFISLYSMHKKTKKDIFKYQFISNLLLLIHYYFLGGFSGLYTKIIAIMRDLVQIKRERYKWLDKSLIVFIVLYLVLFIFNMNNIYSTLPVLAAFIYTALIWNGNVKKVRIVFLICEVLWLIYNIFIFSIPGILSKVIAIINVLFSLMENNIKKSK